MSSKEKDITAAAMKKKKKAGGLVKKKNDKKKNIVSKKADYKENKIDDINNDIKQSYNQDLEGIDIKFLILLI
jgi:hypothetical protein